MARASAAPTHGTGLEAESLPAELEEDIAQLPREILWGPTPVSQVNFLMDYLRLRDLFGDTGIRSFGWVEGGYTGASTGTGMLSVETRQNRFGNEFLFNQIGLTIQKPLQQDEFNLGFNIGYFAGADAALGAAQGRHRRLERRPPLRPGLPRSCTSRPTCRS